MPDVPSHPDAVELLVLDVDGVLTDGLIMLDDRGVETKRFHVRDGAGIRLWTALGHEIAIITGRSGLALRHRTDELGIRAVQQGVKEKGSALEALAAGLGLELSQVAVLGDDLPDLPMLRRCGYPMAVADAVEEVRAISVHVTAESGGRGAVREAIEHLLRSRGQWDEALAIHGG